MQKENGSSDTTETEWFSKDGPRIFSIMLMLVSPMVYAATKNGDLTIIIILAAIWMKMP